VNELELERQAREAAAAARLERLVSLATELASLVLVWRALDGPDPRDLARDAWHRLQARLEARAQYRAAMLDTLEGIRNLPETEARP